jgi:protein-L-isoaspartate(D-aspartate) O-methyltransferase
MNNHAPVFFLLVFVLFQNTGINTSAQPDYSKLRLAMVDEQIISRGITDSRVIAAMLKVPRHLFIPIENRSRAYGDFPVSVGEGQTISQPYIVALMTQLLNLKPGMKVLEIGTGSGYQAAILAEMKVDVFTIEIIDPLGNKAGKLLDSLGYTRINVKTGDGYLGWTEHSPYDAIIVTCSPSEVPGPLKTQLKEGGVMVIPIGDRLVQKLVVLRKKNSKIITENIASVMFVPMVTPEGKRY